MAANTSPIFTLTPNFVVGQTITTANTAKDGTGTVVTIYTAGANGGFVFYVNWQPLGTNVATAGRIFINNGSANSVAANNSYWGDISLLATTNSETASIGKTIQALNISLPAGYKINLTIGTTVAAGFAVSPVAEDY